ncbi:hypothetical protein GAMM_10050 [Gammaproteobacteria bacterium]
MQAMSLLQLTAYQEKSSQILQLLNIVKVKTITAYVTSDP